MMPVILDITSPYELYSLEETMTIIYTKIIYALLNFDEVYVQDIKPVVTTATNVP